MHYAIRSVLRRFQSSNQPILAEGSDTDACVQIQNATGTTIDAVGWGGAGCVAGHASWEGDAYPTDPPEGKSLQRKDNETQIGSYGPASDSDDNSADFFIHNPPNPQNSGADPLPPLPELPSIVLFAFGLLVVAMYIYRREVKRRGEK